MTTWDNIELRDCGQKDETDDQRVLYKATHISEKGVKWMAMNYINVIPKKQKGFKNHINLTVHRGKKEGLKQTIS